MEKEKENTKDLVKEFEKIKKEKMPKSDRIKIIKKIIISLLKEVCLVSLFIVLNIAYSNMDKIRLENDIKIISGILFIFAIITFELAYKKDSGSKTISALELLVISFYTLSIPYILNRFDLEAQTLFITSIVISVVYYFIKTICIYKKNKNEYIKSNSDISDIIKKEAPTKKEALKRKIIEDEEVKQTKPIKAKTAKKKTQSNKKIEKKPNKTVKQEKEKEEKLKAREPEKKQTRKKATITKTSTTKTKEKVNKKDTDSKSTAVKKKKIKEDSKVEGEIND